MRPFRSRDALPRRRWRLAAVGMAGALALALSMFALTAGNGPLLDDDLCPVVASGDAGVDVLLLDLRKPVDVARAAEPGELLRDVAAASPPGRELHVFALGRRVAQPIEPLARLCKLPADRAALGGLPGARRPRRRPERRGLLCAPARSARPGRRTGRSTPRPSAAERVPCRGHRGELAGGPRRAGTAFAPRVLRHGAARGVVLACRYRSGGLGLRWLRRGTRRTSGDGRCGAIAARGCACRGVLRAPNRQHGASRGP